MKNLFWSIHNYFEGKRVWKAKMSEPLKVTVTYMPENTSEPQDLLENKLKCESQDVLEYKTEEKPQNVLKYESQGELHDKSHKVKSNCIKDIIWFIRNYIEGKIMWEAKMSEPLKVTVTYMPQDDSQK
jgi:hypothetical protein